MTPKPWADRLTPLTFAAALAALILAVLVTTAEAQQAQFNPCTACLN